MAGARYFSDYRSGLLLSYEEEVAGEAYFARAAEFFTGRAHQALMLLAQVEAATAQATRSLVGRHGLEPADEARLRAQGIAEADAKRGTPWPDMIADMVMNYPRYVDEFQQLARLAPPGDASCIDVFIRHEVAAIEFARREAAGDPQSMAPLSGFLDELEANPPG